MPKFLYLFFIAFLLSFQINAQEFLVKGTLLDASSKQPMEASTIYAESIQDSTLITYTISERNGTFALEGKTALKEVILYFSYNGYKSLVKKIALKSQVDLGVIEMEEQAQELKGVQVTAERVPITIKKDTLEFNADSFKTRPDATVEDVLKKLPGVEVDSDGKITVNGKEVSQVLVNGQVFFSSDPKVATKSLPKEIISKIQITDTKTKIQEFTGEAGDGETKTINLTIKEDKNNGYLGRLAAGYGTDDRYQLSGLLNYFKGQERVSIIAGSNNINNSGFSFDEIFDMVGNSGGGFSFNDSGAFSIGDMSFGFGQGITTSSNIGASYANQQKDKFEVDANYFFAYSDNFNNEKTSRENILPDGRFFTDTETNFSGTTNSSLGGANLEFDIDPTFRISLQPNMSVSRTNAVNERNTLSSNEEGNPINSNSSITRDDGYQSRFKNKLTLFKKLDTLGRYIRLSFFNDNRLSRNESNFNSIRTTFGDDGNEDILDQKTNNRTDSDSYNAEFTYRQPLAKDMFLDFGYEYENYLQNNTKGVFDFNADSGEYDNFNGVQSSVFKFSNIQQTPSLGIKGNGKKFRFGLTALYKLTNLENFDFLQNTSFDKSYENILFNANANYTIGENKNISIWSRSNLNVPSVTQLQPIPNVSDPLNVVIGNQNLAPAVNTQLYLNYNDYNWKDRTGLFAYLGFHSEKGRVSTITTTDEDLLRTTTYDNIDGNYYLNGGFGYSKQVKKDSTYSIKYSISPYFNYDKNIGFTNGSRLEAATLSLSPRINTTFNFRDLLELEPEYRINISGTKYNLDGLEDVNFISHNLGFKTTTYWPENIVWGNDINYNYNGNVGPGFDKDALFWNMSLGVQMLQKNMTLKVLAYDLLNQNINTRRTTGQDFIQDFQGTVLQRYFMFSATFKFDQFGGKKDTKNNIYWMD
ncbi:outer membrane beta-barrel protein [Sediminicola sp. 1XM1-17]|uniref:outer membrane beta-barrel protein n=1 Tax=Sediminicola sp. 1XM1-17 TaxID=3127702 RepID=UPI0030782102